MLTLQANKNSIEEAKASQFNLQFDRDDDFKLKKTIEQSLQVAAYRPLRQLICQVTPTTVSLYGTVPAFFHKQLAQELVRTLAGHRRVRNSIVVEYTRKETGS